MCTFVVILCCVSGVAAVDGALAFFSLLVLLILCACFNGIGSFIVCVTFFHWIQMQTKRFQKKTIYLSCLCCMKPKKCHLIHILRQ